MEEKFDHAPAKPEAPVDSMLKDMATIILSTFLLIGWVAFIITYPLVRLCSFPPPTPAHMFLNLCLSVRSRQRQQCCWAVRVHLIPYSARMVLRIVSYQW